MESRLEALIERACRADADAVCLLGAALLKHDDERPLALLLARLHVVDYDGFEAIAALARATGSSYSNLIARAAGPDTLDDPITPSEPVQQALLEQLPRPSLWSRLFGRGS